MIIVGFCRASEVSRYLFMLRWGNRPPLCILFLQLERERVRIRIYRSATISLVVVWSGRDRARYYYSLITQAQNRKLTCS
jgi:hypothetical protein